MHARARDRWIFVQDGTHNGDRTFVIF